MRPLIDIGIVRLDGGNHIIMNVHSGRNEIQHLNLRVEGPTGLRFFIENAKVLTEPSSSCTPRTRSPAPLTPFTEVKSWSTSQEGIELRGIGKNEVIAISIPHSYPPQGSAVIALLEVSYQAGSGDEPTEERQPLRTIQIARKISIGLPVQVNVRDFFRGRR